MFAAQNKLSFTSQNEALRASFCEVNEKKKRFVGRPKLCGKEDEPYGLPP
jgi:hypothetical protein